MRSAAALVVALALTACGANGKKPGPLVVGAEPGSGAGAASASGAPTDEPHTDAAPKAAPSGFAEADAIVFDAGELSTWSFAGGKATKLGAVTLVEGVDAEAYGPILRGDWADHDHFFVTVAPRAVFHISAAGMVPVTVPPESAFKAPRPKVDNDADLAEGGEMEGMGLVVGGGEAWWEECPWGFPYDGFQCEVFVSARLWPSATTKTDNTGATPRRWDWSRAPIKGWRLKELDDGHELGCTPPAGTKQKQTQLASDDESEMVYAAEWVSPMPPRLLVIWGQYGLADLIPSRWELHDGCLENVLEKGQDVEPGPRGFWVGDGVMHQNAKVLGPIPGQILFRPPT
jgi:hypothetical protein